MPFATGPSAPHGAWSEAQRTPSVGPELRMLSGLVIWRVRVRAVRNLREAPTSGDYLFQFEDDGDDCLRIDRLTPD